MIKLAFIAIAVIVSAFLVSSYHPKQDSKLVGTATVDKSSKEKLSAKPKKVTKKAFIRSKIKKLFPDVEFKTVKECPKKYDLNDFWSNDDLSGADAYCESQRIDLYGTVEYYKVQKFNKGKIHNYEVNIDAREPIEINFFPSGDVKGVSLWLQGGLVFYVGFEKNLVKTFHSSTELQEKEYEKLILQSKSKQRLQKEKRYPILLEGKAKITKLLNSLCQEYDHKKSCEAFRAIKRLPYPTKEGSNLRKLSSHIP